MMRLVVVMVMVVMVETALSLFSISNFGKCDITVKLARLVMVVIQTAANEKIHPLALAFWLEIFGHTWKRRSKYKLLFWWSRKWQIFCQKEQNTWKRLINNSRHSSIWEGQLVCSTRLIWTRSLRLRSDFTTFPVLQSSSIHQTQCPKTSSLFSWGCPFLFEITMKRMLLISTKAKVL